MCAREIYMLKYFYSNNFPVINQPTIKSSISFIAFINEQKADRTDKYILETVQDI